MFFHSKRSDNAKSSSSSMKLDVRLKKNKILHRFKRRHYENLCCERTSQFYIYFTFSVVVVDLPTDCIFSFLFLDETDVLVLVFSQSTDVFVVNFLVVLKFPIIECFFLRSWPMFQILAQVKNLCCVSVIYIQARVSNED